MKKVTVLGNIHPAGISLLKSDPQVSVTELPDHPPDVASHLGDCDAVIVRMTRIGGAEIDAAPRLRIVARHGVGYDTVDVDALSARGIPLTVVGDVNAVAVAEHTLALMLALARRLVRYDPAVRDGRFDIRNTFSITELFEKTVLVVGFGLWQRHALFQCGFDPVHCRCLQVLICRRRRPALSEAARELQHPRRVPRPVWNNDAGVRPH